MILVGIDDTDVVGSRGTNQLAREIVRQLRPDWCCGRIVRHQLLDDPRVPYTSKNGSASITLARRGDSTTGAVIDTCRQAMRAWFVAGSDPGLCVAAHVSDDILDFGRRCQQELVSQDDAWKLADRRGVHLEALGGTKDGIIGALAAVGLAAGNDDGRVVQLGDWPDDLGGVVSLHVLRCRGVDVRDFESNAMIEHGRIDLGKRLRPNVRAGHVVLFVRGPNGRDGPVHGSPIYQALKLP